MATLSLSLGVRDLERELKFFTALGFEITNQTESSAHVRLGDAELELETYDSFRVADAPLLDWDRAPASMGTGAQIYFTLTEIDAFAARIPVGVSRPWPVQDKQWGMRELTVRSPSGYVVTFGQRRS